MHAIHTYFLCLESNSCRNLRRTQIANEYFSYVHCNIQCMLNYDLVGLLVISVKAITSKFFQIRIISLFIVTMCLEYFKRHMDDRRYYSPVNCGSKSILVRILWDMCLQFQIGPFPCYFDKVIYLFTNCQQPMENKHKDSWDSIQLLNYISISVTYSIKK